MQNGMEHVNKKLVISAQRDPHLVEAWLQWHWEPAFNTPVFNILYLLYFYV
jgi:hypothetical protein